MNLVRMSKLCAGRREGKMTVKQRSTSGLGSKAAAAGSSLPCSGREDPGFLPPPGLLGFCGEPTVTQAPAPFPKVARAQTHL